MKFTRRSLLGSIGAAGVSLTFVGTVSAADGEGQYLITVNDDFVSGRLRRDGFSIENEYAGGSVLSISGPSDATEDLEALSGVVAAGPNAQFEVEIPEALETVELEEEDDEDEHPGRGNGRTRGRSSDTEDEVSGSSEPFFLENQWDKFVTQSLEAHEYATGDGSLITVIDTGIDPDHPDLVDNIDFDNTRLFTSLDALDDHPWDIHGHGTNVSGIAAATGAVGAIGTAPDAEIASLKVFVFTEIDDEVVLATTTEDILAAIDYSAEIGADAANLSLGTLPIPPQGNMGGLRTAYQRTMLHATRQGTFVSASAGNSAANLQQGGYFTLPNSVEGASSISATAPNDELTFYSNFGTNEIDVGAPGGGYESNLKTLFGIREWVFAGRPSLRSDHPLEEGDAGELWLDEDGALTFDPDEVVEVIEFESPAWPYPFNLVFNAFIGGIWAWFAGTSMAAPQVTGLVALLRELDPGLNANQVEQVIKQAADGEDGQSDPQFGAGRINVLAAVESVLD